MFANLVKTFSTRSQVRYTFELTRQLCSIKENIIERRAAKDEEEALKIEASLFDQSSVKYEPVSAEEILKQNRSHKKSHKKNDQRYSSKNFIERTTPINFNRPAVTYARKNKLERQEESRVINDDELGFEYVRLSLGDPRMATMLITARSKKRRDKDRQIIVEGRRLVSEALECGLKLRTILFSQKDQLMEIKDQVAEALQTNRISEIFKVPQHDLKQWSTLTTPPGIMAVFERPDVQSVMKNLQHKNCLPYPLTVVCDNIREPNNLGSIIRTCAALPCFQIVITKGCCDPWDSKALRGGCGGHFRVPIRDDVEWQDVVLTIPAESADDCYVFVAENNLSKLEQQTKIMEYSDAERTGAHNVVVIGGESHGVSEEAYKFMNRVGPKGTCLNIPLAEGIDSLNVASALTLILYELRKNIVKQQLEADLNEPANLP